MGWHFILTFMPPNVPLKHQRYAVKLIKNILLLKWLKIVLKDFNSNIFTFCTTLYRLTLNVYVWHLKLVKIWREKVGIDSQCSRFKDWVLKVKKFSLPMLCASLSIYRLAFFNTQVVHLETHYSKINILLWIIIKVF